MTVVMTFQDFTAKEERNVVVGAEYILVAMVMCLCVWRKSEA